jgi:pimeloyl-ACP methyl ester carboxylesterase
MTDARLAKTLLALILTASVAVRSGPVAAAAAESCQPVEIAVGPSGGADTTLFGVFCAPRSPALRPSTVHLLVHGGTYNHQYWDWPRRPDQYSYARRAVGAGYAVLEVDRLGYGRSTHPASAEVTLEQGAAALHDAITALRDGRIAGYPIPHVVYVGHSVGSIVGWVETSTYRDVDAFVATGMTHHLKRSAVATISQIFYPANQDPAFRQSGLDTGYLTTKPGTRGGFFYYEPAADPDVIALDEQTKDTMASPEAAESLSLILSPPPAAAPSRRIVAPTLVVMGERDAPFCGEPDGLDCTDPHRLLDAEAPYYSGAAKLEILTIPETGHNIQLHEHAGEAADRILVWIKENVDRAS